MGKHFHKFGMNKGVHFRRFGRTNFWKHGTTMISATKSNTPNAFLVNRYKSARKHKMISYRSPSTSHPNCLFITRSSINGSMNISRARPSLAHLTINGSAWSVTFSFAYMLTICTSASYFPCLVTNTT